MPANDRVEVRFPAAADDAPARRASRSAAAAGSCADAAEVALPVWTPATTEAFATYGVIDEGAIAQPVALPGEVVPQFGGLEVTTSSTALQALTDALLYLVALPVRVLRAAAPRACCAIAALQDVLTAFQAEGLPRAGGDRGRASTTDIERLAQHAERRRRLRRSGERGDESLAVPHASTSPTRSARAKAKGFTVPAATCSSARRHYLREHRAPLSPATTPPRSAARSSRYALYVRKLLGDRDIAKRASSSSTRPAASTSCRSRPIGWLLGRARRRRRRPTAERRPRSAARSTTASSETAGAANFTHQLRRRRLPAARARDRRVDARAARGADRRPARSSDLIPKVVDGLLAHRKRGPLGQHAGERASCCSRSTATSTPTRRSTPDFVARVWLGDALRRRARVPGPHDRAPRRSTSR